MKRNFRKRKEGRLINVYTDVYTFINRVFATPVFLTPCQHLLYSGCMHRLVVGILFICIISLLSASTVMAASIQLEGSAEAYNSNGKLHFTDFNSSVSLDTDTGILSGYAWLDDLGWLAMGETDNEQGPVQINMDTGVVTGVAKVINTNTFLDFAASNSNVVMDILTGEFSGYVYDSNLGWIHFGYPGVQTSQPIPTPNPSPTPTPNENDDTAIRLTVVPKHAFKSGEVVLTGTAPANAKVQVQVHSTPQTGAVTATADGVWSWKPPQRLEAGEHYYIARVDNEDGTFDEWSERRYFSVLGEQTVLDNLPTTGAALGSIAVVGYVLVGTGFGARILGKSRRRLSSLRAKRGNLG